ncbi:MAG: Mth938-like domain-containing protein [Gammaproteobacteria bacterium]|nr:MAG: Mth938-like domain-containing protein [Gammaproteobacteria bacterium]
MLFKLVSPRLPAYLPIMQFTQDTSGSNSIQAYRQGEIIINEKRINCSVVITPDKILEWAPQNFDAITSEHIDQLADYQPEIVILGTGERQQFPAPHITAGLLVQGIGVEIMNTDAACRTFNVLLSENRRVVAAMILE